MNYNPQIYPHLAPGPLQNATELGPPPPYEDIIRNAGTPVNTSVKLPNADITTQPASNQEGYAFSYSGQPLYDPQQGVPGNEQIQMPPSIKIPAGTPYKFRYRKKGIVCDDPIVNHNPEAVIKFFIENCSQPKLFVKVQGYHFERRNRVRTNSDGSTSIESHQDYVEDFHDCYDISGLVLPTGLIYAVPDKNGNFMTVTQLASEYVASKNKFKSLKLRKHPVWDYASLETAIRGAIRMAGYCHYINISFPMENDQMCVQSDSNWEKISKNTVVRVLCVISCLWIFAYPVYLLARKKFDHCLRADFQMAVTSQEWFMQNYWVISASARAAVSRSNISMTMNMVSNFIPWVN